jgi:hypothetical protein
LKKILTVALTIILLTTTISYGQITGFDGGVKDDYMYKEVVFITGKPVIVEGEVKTQERQKGDIVTTTYTYELSNTEENMQVKRRVTYETNLYKKEKKGQTVGVTSVDRYSERITVGNDRYNLEDYQFSNSTIYDNRPAVDFYSGNLTSKKTYSINRDKGTVVIEGNSDTIVGYKHYWGASETCILTQDIHRKQQDAYTDGDGDAHDIKWDGLVTLKLSSTTKKDLDYIKNEPTNISFRGGLLQSEKQENILQYEYDLPKFDDDGLPDRRKRVKDEENLRMDTEPIHKRLVIPNLKDISPHWAEESIFTLYSLEIFDDPSPYFGPKLPMTRSEFAKSIVRAISLLEEEENTEKIRRQRIKDGEEEEEIFDDINKEDDNFKYIKFVKEKGIMNGVNDSFFSPDGELTRAQAITILIRTLGLEDLAPNPPYKTHFEDDEDIPFWAKDSIYAANEIGLLRGDSYGRVNPNDTMSKAEAAQFIYRYIKHIKDEITIDYREKIINNR